MINRTLPVCRPLTEVMSVQHYRSYEAFLLGSRSSLVVFKEKSELDLVLFADRIIAEPKSNRSILWDMEVCNDLNGVCAFF